jgi:uncharacterized protein (DUF2062 family)
MGVFKKALLSGSTPKRLARSFCMGVYIAFSPFPGGHSIMMLLSKYLFDLHFPTLFLITSINNPWTMLPFFSFDYAFGYWVVHSLLGLEPSLVLSWARLFGSAKICVWSFLIGGNILGIVAAFACYPFIHRLFKKMATRVTSQDEA